MLYLAVALIVLTGSAHSYLGERYLLVPLFERGALPKLLGSTDFAAGTLRFTWHLTTLAWWCLAYLVFLSAEGTLTPGHALRAVGACAWVSGGFALYFTRARHLSWPVFALVGALLFAAASRG